MDTRTPRREPPSRWGVFLFLEPHGVNAGIDDRHVVTGPSSHLEPRPIILQLAFDLADPAVRDAQLPGNVDGPFPLGQL